MRLDDLPRQAPAAPGKSPTADQVLRVRVNRRRFIWMALASVVLYTVISVLRWNTELEPNHLENLLLAISAGFTAGSITALLQNHGIALIYRTGAKTIQLANRWGEVRVYPRRDRGFERLEYSVHFAEVHEVAPDGHRRKVPVPRWVNRREWAAFVDRFLEDRARVEQAAATTEPIPVAPRAEDRSET